MIAEMMSAWQRELSSHCLCVHTNLSYCFHSFSQESVSWQQGFIFIIGGEELPFPNTFPIRHIFISEDNFSFCVWEVDFCPKKKSGTVNEQNAFVMYWSLRKHGQHTLDNA